MGADQIKQNFKFTSLSNCIESAPRYFHLFDVFSLRIFASIWSIFDLKLFMKLSPWKVFGERKSDLLSQLKIEKKWKNKKIEKNEMALLEDY